MDNPYSLEKWLGTPQVRLSLGISHAGHAGDRCMQTHPCLHPCLPACMPEPQGVDWLAVTIDEYEQKIIRTVGDATEGVSVNLSSWMKDRYRELINRTNIEKGLEAGMGAIDMSMSALALPLTLPLSVTEQVSRRAEAGEWFRRMARDR